MHCPSAWIRRALVQNLQSALLFPSLARRPPPFLCFVYLFLYLFPPPDRLPLFFSPRNSLATASLDIIWPRPFNKNNKRPSRGDIRCWDCVRVKPCVEAMTLTRNSSHRNPDDFPTAQLFLLGKPPLSPLPTVTPPPARQKDDADVSRLRASHRSPRRAYRADVHLPVRLAPRQALRDRQRR